jgi:HAD superfamily hydrolase (TIGR01509 family)
MIKAVVFDMDGVLVNTEPLHYRMWKQAFEGHGVLIGYDVYKQCIGSTAGYLMELIYQNYGVDFRENVLIREEAAKIKSEIIAREGYPLIDGVVSVLKGLHEAGYLLAVASSSPEVYIEDVMERLGARHLFSALCSGEKVVNPKPAPDVFLKAASQLGVQPEECVVFEDSSNGCRAAVSAGMICIGYDNPDSGEQDLSLATQVIRSWEEVTDMEEILRVALG